MRPHRTLAFLFLLAIAGGAQAQGVGINATGAAADTSAILDLSATDKGLLVLRMTAAQRAAIVLPATGLVVHQTDGTARLDYNAGTSGANLYYSAGKAAAGTTPGACRLTVLDTGAVFRVPANNANGVMASFGVAGNRLSLDSDSPNAGVALGYGAAETWVNPGAAAFSNTSETSTLTKTALTVPFTGPLALPGMSKSVTVATTSKALVNWTLFVASTSCFGCGDCNDSFNIVLDGVVVCRVIGSTPNGGSRSESGACLLTLASGAHPIEIQLFTLGGTRATIGGDFAPLGNDLIVQVMSQ